MKLEEKRHGGKWIKGLHRMSTTQEFNQFVNLWSKLQQVQLTSQPDEITRRFSPNSHYSIRSAYQIQFAGSFANFHGKTYGNQRWSTNAKKIAG
jgi:hypothetical protein